MNIIKLKKNAIMHLASKVGSFLSLIISNDGTIKFKIVKVKL